MPRIWSRSNMNLQRVNQRRRQLPGRGRELPNAKIGERLNHNLPRKPDRLLRE